MEKKFRKGEVVWAKVRGFPWWPAMVKSVNIKFLKQDEEEEECRHTTVLVYFIGDNSHSELPINKIEKFSQKYEDYSKTKKKSLLNSIKLAKKIISNELSFEKHLVELNKNEKGKKFRTIEKNEKFSEDESEEKYTTSKNFLGLKRRKRKLIKKKESCPPPKIDFCVEDDFSKNIKINININVNNNTNNTLNITTIGRKIIDDESDHKNEDSLIEDIRHESSMEEMDTNDENIKLSENLKEVINSLLFYKINMPSSTSNKSIIGSLEEIQNKLQLIQKYDTYELIKDLIPILTNFLCNRNQTIVTKSSELFSIIKEKILDELFETSQEVFLSKGDGLNINTNLKNNLQLSLEEMKKKIEDDLEGFKKIQMNINRESSILSEKIGFKTAKSNSLLKRNTRKRSYQDLSIHDVNESLSNINDFDIKGIEARKKGILISAGNSDREITEIIINENGNCNFDDNVKICNKNVSSSSMNTLNLNSNNKFTFTGKSFFNNEKVLINNKRKFSPLDPNQIRFLFKGFIGEDEEIEEKLSGGIYSRNFYKNIYTKYNGLTETLAFKRKHVCIKLLQILKLFLPDIESEELKKTIVFLEYKIRTKDPTLGKIYKQNLEAFYDRLKEILSLATESLNNLSIHKSKFD